MRCGSGFVLVVAPEALSDPVPGLGEIGISGDCGSKVRPRPSFDALGLDVNGSPMELVRELLFEVGETNDSIGVCQLFDGVAVESDFDVSGESGLGL
jgi:hypothetical protein